MDNRYFDREALEVLLAPHAWRLVSTFLGPDVPPISRRPNAARLDTRWHQHPSTDAMIVLHGGGEYGIGRRLYPTEKGTVFFIGESREHEAAYPPRTRALWISLLGSHARDRHVDAE